MSSLPAITPLEITPVGSTIPKGTKQLSLKGCFSGKKKEECTVRIHTLIASSSTVFPRLECACSINFIPLLI